MTDLHFPAFHINAQMWLFLCPSQDPPTTCLPTGRTLLPPIASSAPALLPVQLILSRPSSYFLPQLWSAKSWQGGAYDVLPSLAPICTIVPYVPSCVPTLPHLPLAVSALLWVVSSRLAWAAPQGFSALSLWWPLPCCNYPFW